MGYRVLVIEDNPANLELMTYLLTAFGHTVMTARDGEEGIAAALAHPPEVVLCDLAMPAADGYAVLARLKREPALRGVPMVAVTASAMMGDRDAVIAAGFDGYLTKPIDPETFVGEVAAFAARKEGHGDDPDC